MRFAVPIAAAVLLSGCNQGPETVEQCYSRLSRLADTLPSAASPVHAVYTFDLSKIDSDRRNQIAASGIDGRGPPTIIAANQPAGVAGAAFENTQPGPNGVLLSAQAPALLRVAGGAHASAGDAIRDGCRMLPGARLKAVALTAG
ncbi:hypothetical protein [Sphingomonas hengshuiensis]|uniref:Uncharacterized protein n=1 Tax=Sphingomonas hengshuiensis TaxID=1609977 RepID=A0A7U4J8Z7_9SPHN|nr:hypothetical protein [Sphingomonas hengshuiensis]AJP72439.1 hypothetical protein TS85_12575 [Sphingomonas hengshuiensis]